MSLEAKINLLLHENKGLRQAITQKKKHAKSRKQMAGDDQGVVVVYNPTKVANWRDKQQRQAEEKEQQEALKAAQREQQKL
ncbi:MAG: hypothetical protein M1821_004232 [Bathelium mastoideum]|nr:MAG: hypothetical protein M1821_004232 [Bathelium mastoideum]